jgi:hypothetical protein
VQAVRAGKSFESYDRVLLEVMKKEGKRCSVEKNVSNLYQTNCHVG